LEGLPLILPMSIGQQGDNFLWYAARLFRIRWREVQQLLLSGMRFGASDAGGDYAGVALDPLRVCKVCWRTHQEVRMIERRHIDHKDLVQLGKTVLLLFKRQELLVDLPASTQLIEQIVPTKELTKELEWTDVDYRSGGTAA
jgi:hypothetical protein